jgi:F0F1-type ATP synthase membrane subunit b/b'
MIESNHPVLKILKQRIEELERELIYAKTGKSMAWDRIEELEKELEGYKNIP